MFRCLGVHDSGVKCFSESMCSGGACVHLNSSMWQVGYVGVAMPKLMIETWDCYEWDAMIGTAVIGITIRWRDYDRLELIPHRCLFM